MRPAEQRGWPLTEVESAKGVEKRALRSGAQPFYPLYPTMTTYNKSQWIDSFEGQLSLLKPHLVGRILATMSLSAWHQYGAKGEDPIKAAKTWVAELDKE